MTRRFYLLLTILLLLITPCFIRIGYGNPVVPEPVENPFIRVLFFICLFFIGAGIEYGFFNRKILKFYSIARNQYKMFLKINFITFPLTQILAYVIYIYFLYLYWFYIFLIELGIILFEAYLYRIELERLVKEKFSPKLILKSSLIANTISFLVGLLAYLPVLYF